MTSDSKLPVAIFATIAVLIALPFFIDHVRELRRPVLLEARVVSATASDPTFREGRRRVPAGESIEATVAIRVGRRGTDGSWLAPVGLLAFDGQETEHVQTESWPEAGRVIRVFWFSVESTNLGGGLNEHNAADRLRYRTFFAPEMGRGLRADRLPEIHNDDHIGDQSTTALDGAGTIRLYARVEVVEADSDIRPLQVATTSGVESVHNPLFPTISIAADLGDAVDPSVGELFRLPGFEPRSESGAWDDVTSVAFGASFTELVAQRFVVSSHTLAAVATAGRPDVSENSFVPLGTLAVTPDRVGRPGRPLKWGIDVEPGDLLVENGHWWVLLGDDGNGELDPTDPVLHCWGRPPERTTLWASLETESASVQHLRYED